MSNDVTSPEFDQRFGLIVARLDGGPLLPCNMGAGAAVLIIAQLQLALRHPENRGPMAEAARGFVEQMIDAVVARADNPADAQILRRGLEAGFDPACDTPRGELG